MPRNAIPTFTATRWTPLEVSMVNIGADPSARVRSLEGSMPETIIRDTIEPGAERRANPVPGLLPADGGAAAAERSRVLGIQQAGQVLRLPGQAAEMVTRGISLEAARSALFAAAVERDAADQAVSRITMGADHGDPGVIGERMQAALLHRADPGRYKLPPEAQEFRGLSLVEMRRTMLGAAGVNCRGWNADKVLGFRRDGWLSRDLGGLMTTSDLPNLLTATGNRLLEDAYAMAASPIKSHSRQRSASDFRTLTTLRAGNISALALVNEHGEVTRGQAAEAKESFSVSTYAKIWGFTREAIVNNDLDALSSWAQEMGAAAAETEASLFVELLTASAGLGPIFDDGTTLFHSNHGNYVASGTAIGIETLSDGREAMRSQKGINGVFPIGVGPVAILVGPANETVAEQVVATLQPDQMANANPFSGKLRVEVEPRLSGYGWYLFSESPAFQHAYLNGQAGPMLDSKEGFDVLGVEFRCVLDIGVHVRDYRFAFHNAGADPFAG